MRSRILASLIDDPRQVTEAQMEKWVLDIDSWDIATTLQQPLLEGALSYEKLGMERTS